MDGETLGTREVCDQLGLPYMTVYRYAHRLFPWKRVTRGPGRGTYQFTEAEVAEMRAFVDALREVQAQVAALGVRAVVSA